MVDTDGKGYIIYSSNSMNVEELTLDYYYTTNNAPFVFPETFVEAPVLMKINETYYALYDWCCCYCLQGSGVMVYRASSPLGPYTQQVSRFLLQLALAHANPFIPQGHENHLFFCLLTRLNLRWEDFLLKEREKWI